MIGAGITGIRAAIDLHAHGVDVLLIEKEPYVGGHVAQLNDIFPTGEGSMCLILPEIDEVARSPGITVHTMTGVSGISGEPGNFTLTLIQHPRYVDADKCTGCRTCEEICPVEVYSKYDAGIGVRKAVYKPYDEAFPAAAVRDYDHCINCGLCFDVCPNGAVLRDEEDSPREFEEKGISAVIIATGFEMYDPANEPRYRYLTMPDVMTSLEFERMISPSGPTGGEIRRLSDGRVPKSIVFVQCVGSRNVAIGRNFCSSVCCMYTIRNANAVKERYGDDIKVTILKSETRAYGKGYQEYNHRIKKKYDIQVYRCTPGSIECGSDKRMRIIVEKVKKGHPETPIITLEPELVVLAAGLSPSKSAGELSCMAGIDLSEDSGFLSSGDVVLDPAGSPSPGIFIAGAAVSPRDISDCINQAKAAAMKAFVYTESCSGEGKTG